MGSSPTLDNMFNLNIYMIYLLLKIKMIMFLILFTLIGLGLSIIIFSLVLTISKNPHIQKNLIKYFYWVFILYIAGCPIPLHYALVGLMLLFFFTIWIYFIRI